MNRIRLVLLIAAACIALSSCASPTSRAGSAGGDVNLTGYPKEFRQGYSDGCASVQGPRTRDESRFKSDSQYAQGWRDGYDICRRKP